MKIVKMSLAAAVLVGASAFAIDNVKVAGNAQVFYSTNDSGTNKSLFDKEASSTDVGLHLNASADLAKNDLVSVSAGAGFTALTTLGLENNFVSGVWGGAHTASNYTTNNSSYNATVNDASWFNEAWLAISAGKTTLKAGRMALDTPLAFTEKWSIEENTFEAAVAINQDIPDTTLVAAFVGNGNGTEGFGTDAGQSNSLTAGGVVNGDGKFETYGENGAYAAGIVNNSFKPLTVQAWYYDVTRLAQAYWLQADLNMDGILAGAQYTSVTLDKGSYFLQSLGFSQDLTSNAYALMLGYSMKDTFTAKVSYSSVGDSDKTPAGYNTATKLQGAQSKLYTEAWWNYGYVTESGATAYNVTVEVPVKGIVDLGVYYTSVDQSAAGSTYNGALTNGSNGVKRKLTETTATLSRSFGPLDTSLVYSNVKATDQNNDKAYNQVQAYLTLNF